MPEPLKNVYTAVFFTPLMQALNRVLPVFNPKQFVNDLFDEEWEEKELKQRMRHISTVLQQHLPGSYQQQVALLLRIVRILEDKKIKGGFEYMFIPDFVEQFGLSNLKTSLSAMETMTQFVSCEFAIRPFLLKHQQEVMKQMLIWSRHKHANVRRFSSEGCRPRLPWAMAIPTLKKDPSPIIPILENLKSDPSLFVRKSVANNLNDIAKDHPDLVTSLVKKWKGLSGETDWIVRHGCRTLLKKANAEAYDLYGLSGGEECSISGVKLNRSTLYIGEKLRFSFQLVTARQDCRLRLEYAIYYAKAKGKPSRKIFQLKEDVFAGGRTYDFSKTQTFQDLTTRKHYPGKHRIEILVNGVEKSSAEFCLKAEPIRV